LSDDRELWERICRADIGAFESFYQAYASRLERFLRKLVGNRQAAEDLAQDTFATMWQHPNGFDPDRGTLRAYLFGAARKRAAEWWRKQVGRQETPHKEPVECKTETVWLITDALAQLPEEERTLIWLREVEGHSYAELAEILGILPGTVKSRLFAARERMRKTWQQAAPPAKQGDL
jgi:RNA polymerase sigma-70 factor, ECF subfamily